MTKCYERMFKPCGQSNSENKMREQERERERERKHVNESEKERVRESLQTWEECMIKGTHDGWGCALKGQNHFIDNL